MAKMGRMVRIAASLFALALPGLMGCQTNINGMTLPSGYYLKDEPQYIPKQPEFPLINELNQQQRAYDNTFGPGGKFGPGALPQP